MPSPSTKPLIAVALLAVVGTLLLPPLAQDPAYHAFADQRSLWGIPNFGDAMSNLPFVVIGTFGLRTLAHGCPRGGLPELLMAYRTFFAGLLLVGIGSLYYHLEPNNTTLVWDRLPMTIAFMAFFTAIVGEHLSPRLAMRLLWPLILLGIATVAYWRWTEVNGRGDLRPYGLVQFMPMVLIPLILLRYPSRLHGTGYLWAVLAAYALAKAAEAADRPLYALGGLISGHTLKHLLAAAGGYTFLTSLREREPVPGTAPR